MKFFDPNYVAPPEVVFVIFLTLGILGAIGLLVGIYYAGKFFYISPEEVERHQQQVADNMLLREKAKQSRLDEETRRQARIFAEEFNKMQK